MNKWDERYNQAEYYYGKEPNDFLKQMEANFPAHARILCLADGG